MTNKQLPDNLAQLVMDNYVASLSVDELLRKNANLANCVRFLIDGCCEPNNADEALYNWDQNRGKSSTSKEACPTPFRFNIPRNITVTTDRPSTPECCSGGPQWGHAWDCKTLP